MIFINLGLLFWSRTVKKKKKIFFMRKRIFVDWVEKGKFAD